MRLSSGRAGCGPTRRAGPGCEHRKLVCPSLEVGGNCWSGSTIDVNMTTLDLQLPDARREANTAANACNSGSTFAERCSRPEHTARLSTSYRDIGNWPTAGQLPIVYHDLYNITFFGIEKLHPFDAAKYRKVLRALVAAGVMKASQICMPKEATVELLLDVHTEEYLTALHTSNMRVVQVTELPALLMLPKFLVQSKVVRPMKYHVCGTMLAAALAIERGWSINLGGGMHHASSNTGMGWCPFDDILLAVRRLRLDLAGRVQKVLLIDLDAHQADLEAIVKGTSLRTEPVVVMGNGVERDKLATHDEDLFILDMYNAQIFPRDEEAKRGIDINVELRAHTSDAEYLHQLQRALQRASAVLPSPDLIMYNAGTDILIGDPLGRLAVSQAGVLKRDHMVWQYALDRGAPICHLLSGGYAKENAAVISESLVHLFSTFHLAAQPRNT